MRYTIAKRHSELVHMWMGISAFPIRFVLQYLDHRQPLSVDSARKTRPNKISYAFEYNLHCFIRRIFAIVNVVNTFLQII